MLLIKKLSIYTAACIILVSCTKLDENDPSSFTESNFPTNSNPVSFQLFAAAPIAHLRNLLANQQTWELHETSTDECVVPIRGGGWFDNGKWRDMHFHTYKSDNPVLKDSWSTIQTGISRCNTALLVLEKADDGPAKKEYIAQVRTVRAYYHFLMMDLWGNVPIVTKADLSEGLPGTKTRTEVFNFIEKELKEAEVDLTEKVDASTYGQITKWMAKTLLAKLYVNALAYTGTPKWDDCISKCTEVISSGKYDLTSNFLSIFAYNNGPQIKEIIFSIVNDEPQKATQLTFPQRFLPGGFSNSVDYKAGTWAGYSTLSEFYDKFNDPNDQRNKQWRIGLQAFSNGAPVMEGTKQVQIQKELKWGVVDPANPFNVGACDTCNWMGAKNMKYSFDPTSTSSGLSNDFVLFRYADVLMMKAEAEARKADNPNLALAAFNQVRARSNAAALPALTWDIMLDERGREFAYEGWRRNDMIRFGKWESAFGLKTDNTITRRIYPIPQFFISGNPNLKQNPGYN
ncbi:RagB/SusD family nutrient uptake outer membrane protein [Lacibacter sp.]|uniref:RagB/SusD family nutrient uptake outer membrane protein n=1 Tax=Lacibacter sp. TaxID=1915409 RepID=UPI002B4ACD55|nr:RagB/SusD family nutrient uptake outer membrane protein [Lacibacter sp.]HLP37608.1 RagB/SusD family nutrient uptake outer membrane protein [Lacibacter sp.]